MQDCRDVELRVRYNAVLLYAEGRGTTEIAAVLGCSTSTALRAATRSRSCAAGPTCAAAAAIPIHSTATIRAAEAVGAARHSKFGKSRLVPLHVSTQRRLRKYAVLRDRICAPPASSSFLVSENGKRITPKFEGKVFLRVARRAGLREPRGRTGPRLHDLRHTFAVRTLLTWYRSGGDVGQYIPRLSTYLGHRLVADTYWYISATPELLRLAALRAEAHLEDTGDGNAS